MKYKKENIIYPGLDYSDSVVQIDENCCSCSDCSDCFNCPNRSNRFEYLGIIFLIFFMLVLFVLLFSSSNSIVLAGGLSFAISLIFCAFLL